MKPKFIYTPVFIIIGSIILSNCSKNSNSDNTLAQKDSLNAVSDYHITTLTNDTTILEAETEDLYISVISSNELLFPLARYHSNAILMNPWTEMWTDEGQLKLNKSIPKEWYLYSRADDSGDTKINVKGTRIAEFGCLMNWVVTFTDVPASDSASTYFGPDVGFAFNHRINLLSDSAMTANKHRFANIKSTLGLIDNDVDGESRIIYTDRMYFHWHQSIFGIIESRGYESKTLLIIQIESNGVNNSLEVGLGGC